MGCDIHPEVQVRVAGGDWLDGDVPERLNDRTYGRFAFLTGGAVRNYSGVPEVLPKPRGFPPVKPPLAHFDDMDWRCPPDYYENHSASYLTLAELLAVDYEQKFVDMRPPFTGDPSFVPGEPITLREFLGEGWFEILHDLMVQGTPDNVRIVFDFDN